MGDKVGVGVGDIVGFPVGEHVPRSVTDFKDAPLTQTPFIKLIICKTLVQHNKSFRQLDASANLALS